MTSIANNSIHAFNSNQVPNQNLTISTQNDPYNDLGGYFRPSGPSDPWGGRNPYDPFHGQFNPWEGLGGPGWQGGGWS